MTEPAPARTWVQCPNCLKCLDLSAEGGANMGCLTSDWLCPRCHYAAPAGAPVDGFDRGALCEKWRLRHVQHLARPDVVTGDWVSFGAQLRPWPEMRGAGEETVTGMPWHHRLRQRLALVIAPWLGDGE